jgi:hypothetical protein
MPCTKCEGGYQIKDYPKVYPTKAACEKRASQMEMFSKMSDKDKKAAYEKAK